LLARVDRPLPEFLYLRDRLRTLTPLIASQSRRIEANWKDRSLFAPMELVSREYAQVLGIGRFHIVWRRRRRSRSCLRRSLRT